MTAVWFVLDVVGSTVAASVVAMALTVALVGLWLVLPTFSKHSVSPP